MLRRVIVVLGVLLGLMRPAFADTLERALERGYFVYGGDMEGGGPYMFPAPDKPDELTGFEVDLADSLAGALSRRFGRPVTARFFQGPWDQLPNLLQTDRIDLVLNGYEWSAERAAVMRASEPYYIYRLQLLARAADQRLDSLAALGVTQRDRVGVLGASAAERLVRERWGDTVELTLYDGNTNAMADVVRGRLDATIQDYPIAVFYRKDFPALRFVDAPVAPGSYVMFGRREDAAFIAALDQALAELQENGTLRRIYARYGIWTDEQNQLGKTRLAVQAGTPPSASATPAQGAAPPSFWARHGRTLLAAAGMTVVLSVFAMPLAICFGVLVALGRMYGKRWLALPLTVYVEVLRGTPLLLQLLVIFYLLPSLGLTLPAVVAGILGLAINYSAYEAEIYRAGLQAVPAGQLEAALTLGMSRALAVRRIVLPQAGRIVIPAVTNDFIALFKDTSVCSVITVVELSKRYNIEVNNHPAELLPLAAIVAILYLVMSYPLSVLSKRVERRLHGGARRVGP